MRGAASVAAIACAGWALACGPLPHSRAAGALSPLSVRSVDWNPTRAPLAGRVRAVADLGNVVAVFADGGATIFSAGAAVATDHVVTDWQAAQTISGADGSARWIVGISEKGHLYYLRGLSSFEDVTDRYGLGGERIVGAAALGGGAVGFLLPRAFAVADGREVTRYAAGGSDPRVRRLRRRCGGSAAIAAGTLEVFDVARKAVTTYPLAGVKGAVFGPNGRLYAMTSRGLYAADPQGRLVLVYDAVRDALHGLVVSGSYVWFADGRELGVIDGERAVETTGARIATDASLAPSNSGDVLGHLGERIWTASPAPTRKRVRHLRMGSEPSVRSSLRSPAPGVPFAEWGGGGRSLERRRPGRRSGARYATGSWRGGACRPRGIRFRRGDRGGDQGLGGGERVRERVVLALVPAPWRADLGARIKRSGVAAVLTPNPRNLGSYRPVPRRPNAPPRRLAPSPWATVLP